MKARLAAMGVVGTLVAAAAASPLAAQQGWEAVVVTPAQPSAIQPFGTPVVTPARKPRPPVASKPAPEPVTVMQRSGLQIAAEKAVLAGPQQDIEQVSLPEASVATAAASDRESKQAGATLARQYCANIVDAAVDARAAWQKKVLTDMEQELDKRIALLDARTNEYRQWLARRDEFSRKAQEGLVGIYARMRPDSAALQLASMDEETAAAILVKLDPRIAGAVLNEMVPAQAARLTATISGAAKISARAAPKPEETRQP